jgi:crotonobetainyl-CoA:carnitine CoA-transferase CaiB-like acyl-CoA transferase
MSSPLSGIRVLDLSRVAAGPFSTMFMSDLGAEVIKVERPGVGDEVRALGRPLPGWEPTKSDYYVGLNRSKRSVALDLGTKEGVGLACSLAASCDIVVENFRPGVADRLGVGFEVMRKIRPAVVYTSITGFGPTGPWADKPANDIMMQSLSGLMDMTGEASGPPARLGTSICDYGTGLFAFAGTMAALACRDRHPDGQHVEVSLFDSSLAMVPNLIPKAYAGIEVNRSGRLHPQIIGYGTYECSDGRFITVGAFSEGFWRRLCQVVGRADWLSDPELATNALRFDRREEVEGELGRLFAQRTREQWGRALTEADVPNAPVLSLVEAVHSEQAQHNETVMAMVDGEQTYGVVRSPLRSAQWEPAISTPSEGIGQSTSRVLHQLLGFDDVAIDELAGAGAFGLPRDGDASK